MNFKSIYLCELCGGGRLIYSEIHVSKLYETDTMIWNFVYGSYFWTEWQDL